MATTTDTCAPLSPGSSSTSGSPGERTPRRGRPGVATRSPLAVACAALASFLAVLVLLSARLSAGHDPALGAATASIGHVSHSGHAVVRTTASGRVIAGSSSPGAGAGTSSGSQAEAIITRTSGGQVDGGRDD